MSKLNSTEKDIYEFKNNILPKLQGNECDLSKKIIDAAELGIRSFNSVKSIRPLIVAVWKGMCDRNDPDRFAVGAMINEIDNFLSFWVVNDKDC